MNKIYYKDIPYKVGGDSTLVEATITERGETSASDFRADGFSKVNVNVPYTDVHYAKDDIVSFEGEDFPLKSLTADITALQDLHGYDAPWVGGGGKNKLPMTVEGIKAVNSVATWTGNSCTINGVTFTIQTDNDGNVTGIKANGTATSNATLYLIDNIESSEYPFAGMILSGGVSSGEYVRIEMRDSPWTSFAISGDHESIVKSSVTQQGTSDISTYVRVLSGYTSNNTIFKPMIRLATISDSTFAPYSNICPISGWSAVDVTRCGKNLFDYTHFQFVDMGYINGYGVWEGSRTIKNYPTDNIGNEWNSLLIDVSALRSQNVSFSGFVGSTAIGIIDENFKVL
jgi:hypothetical protein